MNPRTSPRNTRTVVIAILCGLAVAITGFLVFGGSDDDEVVANDTTTSATTGTTVTTSLTETTDPSTTLATIPPGTATGLGAVAVTGNPESCPLQECMEVEVTCPDIPPAAATVAVGTPDGDAQGVVVLFSGALGNTYWANPEQGRQAGVLTEMTNRGYEVVEVAWPGDGWGGSPTGQSLGFAKLACRSATIINWVHDERYAPLGLDPSTGSCGFCVSGNSGGASQIAYALGFYGLDSIIDAAVLSSGPPHASISRGCLGEAGDEDYAYGDVSLPLIDSAYGFAQSAGPCADTDSDFSAIWEADSIVSGGSDYVYETTRVEVLLGDQDRTVAPAHGRLYVDTLLQAGSPMVELTMVAGMQHEVLGEAVSREAVLTALFGTG